jgi:hypothetical protein
MKRLALCLSMLLALLSPSYAAVHIGTGTVYLLRSHISFFGPDEDWFSLAGVSSLGTCKTADGGYVVLRLRDDAKGQRMFTLVLAAKTAGTPLTVWVDDNDTDSAGYCWALSVQ